MEVSLEQSEHQEPVKTSEPEFYAVSQKKFLIMFIGTFGVYTVYWFYKHWSLYKKTGNEEMWPVMRAIFNIFFTHSLFLLFEMEYKNKTGKAAKSMSFLATVFVVVSILSNISGKLADHGYGVPLTHYLGVIVLPISCWCLYQAQGIANCACDDPNGSSNSRLTFLNYAWLVCGAIIWLGMTYFLYEISVAL